MLRACRISTLWKLRVELRLSSLIEQTILNSLDYEGLACGNRPEVSKNPYVRTMLPTKNDHHGVAFAVFTSVAMILGLAGIGQALEWRDAFETVS